MHSVYLVRVVSFIGDGLGELVDEGGDEKSDDQQRGNELPGDAPKPPGLVSDHKLDVSAKPAIRYKQMYRQ